MCLSYTFTRVSVFIAKTGEQDMHQLYDVLPILPMKVFAPVSKPVNPRAHAQRERVPLRALAREWVWNMLGPFGMSLNTQL